MNPRYTAYLKTTNTPKNHEFMIWIDKMKIKYHQSIDPMLSNIDALYNSIGNQDKFTEFIEKEIQND